MFGASVTQHNDAKQNGFDCNSQHKRDSALSILMLYVAFLIFMLSDVVPNVFIQNVVAPLFLEVKKRRAATY
jgi:hypothetical protein